MAKSAETKPMPGTPNELIADAQLVARHASLAGILPDQTLLAKIVEAKKLLSTDTWAPQIEQDLQWELNKALKLIAPYTIGRLREESNCNPNRIRATFRFVSIALIVVSLLSLAVLIPLTASFNQMKVSLSSISELLDDTNTKVDMDYNLLAQKLLQSQSDSKAPVLTAEDLAVQQRWQNRQYRFSVESQLAVNNLHYFEDTMSSALKPVTIVSSYYSSVFIQQATGGAVQKIDNQETHSDWDVLDQKNMVPLQFLLSCKRVIENKLAYLGSFILPLLYGLLGASVFLLRSCLSFDALDSAARRFATTAWLRLGLGAISGLAVGWFSLQPDAQKLTTTPFAVAFIAGFSIELLFSMLDRIISAIGTQSPAKSSG